MSSIRSTLNILSASPSSSFPYKEDTGSSVSGGSVFNYRNRPHWVARPTDHSAGPPPELGVRLSPHPAPQQFGSCHEYLWPPRGPRRSSGRGSVDGATGSCDTRRDHLATSE